MVLTRSTVGASSATTPAICRHERRLTASLIPRAPAPNQIAGSTALNQTTAQNESLLAYRTAKAITEAGRATAETNSAVDIALKRAFESDAIWALFYPQCRASGRAVHR